MPEIPASDTPAPIPQTEAVSAAKIAKFIEDCYLAGIRARYTHEVAWMKVRSIMRGVHYFERRNGVLVPLPKKAGQIRAIVPLMKPMYRRELGRINSNQVGATAIAKASGDGFFMAKRAQAILDDWIDSAHIQAFFDDMNQKLLYYGLVGIYRYADSFRKQVYLKALPAPELFPIPAETQTWEEMDGLMRVTLVTRQWCEHQDQLYQARTGRPPEIPMAKSVGTYSVRPHIGYAGYGLNTGAAKDMSGALATWFWMKPTEQYPRGQSGFMIDNKLVRFNPGVDADGVPALPGGVIPIEPVYYTKVPDDWYGFGFNEDLIAPQLEADRQMTTIIKSAARNTGFTAFNSDLIDPKDIKNSIDGLVGYREPGYDSRMPPVSNVAGTTIGRDVGVVLQLVQENADRGAGYESKIIYGQQEGRTEGGPATSMLNVNAQAPLQPVVDRIYDALKKTYPHVLDLLKAVWPDQRVITSVGPLSLGNEMVIKRDDMPWSRDVIIKPLPILANGKNTLMSLLFQLRGMPADNGEGQELKSREFRRSLHQMGMTPPGIDLIDKGEQRILYRIARLIGDGVRPDLSVSAWNNPQCKFENHRKAMELFVETMLDPSFRAYSPEVQGAVAKDFMFHQSRLSGIRQPDNFDDAIAEVDARQAEDFLEAAENDPETAEGQFALDGVPIGAP